MVSLKEKVQAEKENIAKVLWYLQRAIGRKGTTELSLAEELAPIATFLYEAYNGIENILKLALTATGINIPSSEKWHVELLELAEANSIISEELSDHLKSYLGFRHVFAHTYVFNFDESKLMPLANNIQAISEKFIQEIDTFTNTLNQNQD